MKYRTDLKSGNKLSVLGFGCLRLPGSLGLIDMHKTEILFKKAIKKGINYFDTAYLYPGSETALGHIVKKLQVRDKIYIATKLPITQCKVYSDFDKYFNIQLERLQTNYIDYYLMHAISGPSQWIQLCALGIEKWIEEKKQLGQIRNLGMSFHGARDDFVALLKQYEWDFCQIQYNYINTNYQAGTLGLKKAAEKGISVFIMEPLLGGRLANSLPIQAEKIFKKVNSDLSPAGWALRWLWNQPEVTVVLSGMNKLSQLDDNAQLANTAAPYMLSKKEMSAIERVVQIFNHSYKIPCTGCNYCMPCPQKINIPACFSAYNSFYSISKATGLQSYIMSTGAMSQTPHYASDCIKCGKCEKHCPQHISIRDSLSDVSRKLESFWLKPLLSTVRKFRL